MGVFFRREPRGDALSNMQAAISPHIEAALRQAPPATDSDARQRRDELAGQAAQAAISATPTPTATVMQPNWKGFLVALALFAVLLAITIVLDWRNMVDDPKVYSGMTTTVLGVLLGLLTGEAVGTASSA
jgi:hypothetical protein